MRMAAAFVAAVLATGAVWWLPAYGELGIISYGWRFAVIAALVAAVVATRVLNQSLMLGAAAGGGGVATVLIRIIVETIADPTSHNLFPFELILASLFAVPSALLGAVAGFAARRTTARKQSAAM